jgi:hypothetical protein
VIRQSQQLTVPAMQNFQFCLAALPDLPWAVPRASSGNREIAGYENNESRIRITLIPADGGLRMSKTSGMLMPIGKTSR